MSVCGQRRDGSVLRLSRPPRCIRAELYLHIVVYLCANCVVSMLRLLMDTRMLVISGIVLMRKPYEVNTLFVSDAYIKYAKPYAVQKILDNTNLR